MDDFPQIGVRRWSNNYTSEEPMNYLGRFSNTFASEGSPILLPKFGSVFSRTISFFLKRCFLIHGLGKCEEVDEDSGHGIGHVDIRVGSLNCLNVIVCHVCALRWGVTHVGNYLYLALLTLSRNHHFRYRKCARERRSLEAAFRRKPSCGFGIFILYNMY